ncbi:GTP-dependent dephospho-CoA kinase family protein [Halomicroarcula sp. GCM10025709]|uniref:GTP-dependent dephospho-CoA kinase family protein n=1 Tax=Haloarcula TaxID=2237 RepID=UPI0024C3452A|nr:GTP-dependent dephospho-CoA kinase family protein [Halomicroarcula sp. YJ-61-S]
MATVVLELPAALRTALKEPLGPIYTDTAALLADAGDPIVAVGDIVTYHLLEADRTPDVALVDGRTHRSAVDEAVEAAVDGFDREVTVENPAATLTEELLAALRAGLDDDGTTLLVVDGEEDLAALPAVLAVPPSGSVVYGQPDEGMVLVTPDGDARDRARSLLERMDGDSDRALAVLRGE